MANQASGDVIAQIADEVLATFDARAQMQSLAARYPDFDLDAAYRVTARVRALREGRGERPVGRKLGFTNRNIWDEYRVYAPIWSYVYDTTVRDVDPAGSDFELASVVEPRIEPEITLGLDRDPQPDMDEAALLGCVGWVAHGFEVVQSLFPGWKFAPADTVAAFGLHGALRLGPRHAVSDANRAEWLACLTSFEVHLSRNGREADKGHARNVLGGPLSALRDAVAVLDRDPLNPQIAAGELVTTGTVTRAFPMSAGEVWRSAFVGAPFEGLTLRLV